MSFAPRSFGNIFFSFYLSLTMLMLYLLFLNFTLIFTTLTNHPNSIYYCARASWVIRVPVLDKWLPDKAHVGSGEAVPTVIQKVMNKDKKRI